MFDKIDTTTWLIVGGYVPVLGAAVWYRLRFNRAIAAMPEAERAVLGLRDDGGGADLIQTRRIAGRLVLRGFPRWTALPDRAWRDLALHRVLMLCACFYVPVVVPLVYDVWFLVPPLCGLVALFLLIWAWWVGPWPARNPSGPVR